MFIQRILRNAVLAELLLFLMVANCAPSRPREDAGRVPGSPASTSFLSPHTVGGSGSNSSRNKSQIKNRKQISPLIDSIEPFGALFQDPANEIEFRRVYRWSTGCSTRSGANLLRFLPDGGVDARGHSNDPNTDIELSSVGLDGKLYILSKTRKLYLCFNKEGRLVTKERPGPDKTLCQFYEIPWHGNRRFVSVYRRHKQQQQQASQVPHPITWRIPVPGKDWNWNDGSVMAAGQPLIPTAEVDDWQVGFGRSGQPLKGSAWSKAKHRSCFDLVEHTDHVRSSSGVQSSPVEGNKMSLIFHSENSVTTSTSSSTGNSHKLKKPANVKNKNSSKSSASVNKNNPVRINHSVANRNTSLSKHKLGESLEQVTGQPVLSSNIWKAAMANKRNRISNSSPRINGGQSKKKVKEDRSRKVNPRTSAEPELPRELRTLLVEEKEEMADGTVSNVDFDSYLAETEHLMAHPEEVVSDNVAPAAVEYAPADVSLTAASPVHSVQRSSFIHRESGGWEEVIVNRPVDSSGITLQEGEDDDMT